MTEQEVVEIIEKDAWMMEALKAVETLKLPDWWIGAGFVRSKVWDHLHNYKQRTPLPDIDVIYLDRGDFDPQDMGKFSTSAEDMYQDKLKAIFTQIRWSVTNQARMHGPHHTKPYKTSIEALADWCETATCVGVRIEDGVVVLAAPHGVNDLVNLRLKKIPEYDKKYTHDPGLFERRMREKNWLMKWPRLKIIN